MTKLFANPMVRLAGRAILVGVSVFLTGYIHTGAVNRGLIVAAVLAAGEVFTPLNALVGIFKPKAAPAPLAAAK